MKKQLLVVTAFAVTLTLACKKGGETQPENGSNIVHKSVNLALYYNHPVFLDIDDDGQNDFYLYATEAIENDQQSLYMTMLADKIHGSRMIVEKVQASLGWGFWVTPMEKGGLISAQTANERRWNTLDSGFLLLSTLTNENDTYLGPWVGKQDRYVGIQLQRNGKTHYGWIKLSHSAGTSRIFIREYAFNALAETAVKAGEV